MRVSHEVLMSRHVCSHCSAAKSMTKWTAALHCHHWTLCLPMFFKHLWSTPPVFLHGFDASDEVMQTCLATALVNTQQQVIANPPTFVSIQRKYTKRASTPALSNASSLSTGLPNGAGGRAASPEVSSSSLSDPASTLSQGSLGVADFMDLGVLRRAKKWRFDKLSKAELAGLINHHMKQDAPQSATKGYLVKFCSWNLLPVTPSTKLCSHSYNC